MTTSFDSQTLEKFRRMEPREAFDAVKRAVYNAGPVGSDDFLDAYEQLVEHGVLSWDQVEEFDT